MSDDAQRQEEGKWDERIDPALADQALADFAAAEGIAIESDSKGAGIAEAKPGETSSGKQMGPEAQTQ